MTNDEHLRRRLAEDTGSPNEAEQWLPVVRRLQTWASPQPTIQQTSALIARLQVGQARGLPQRANAAFAALLLRAQLRIVRREIWAASTLVMLVGTLVTQMVADTNASNEGLPIVFFAPIVTAIGIAFLYGPAVDSSLEIELATPVSPRVVLLARLALVFDFNLLLGLIGSVALAGPHSGISLWPLVMTWLAPMTFLSALTFLFSVLFFDSLAGVVISLLLWGLQTIRHASNGAALLVYLPDLLAADTRPWLFGSALLLGGLALWIAGRDERWAGYR